MNNVVNNLANVFNALAYYIAAAVSAIVSNRWLLIGTIIAIFTLGRSVKIGRLISYKSK